MTVSAVTQLDVALQVNPVARRDAFFIADKNIYYGWDGAAASAAYGQIYYTAATNEFRIDATKVGAGTAPPTVFRTGNTPTQVMRITTASEVIIGTGTTVVTSGATYFQVQVNHNAGTETYVVNTDAGTVAYSAYNARNNSGSNCSIFITSSGYATVGDVTAATGFLSTDAATGLVVRTAANTPILFSTNSTNVGRWTSAGELIIGAGITASLATGNILLAQKNFNGDTSVFVKNTTSGTAALSGFHCQSEGLQANFNLTSPGFTPSGVATASTCFLSSDATSGIAIWTYAAAPILFHTNSVNRARYLSTGEYIYGATTLTGAEKFKIVGVTLIEGTVTVTGAAPGANNTNLYLAEGVVPTTRQVQWVDSGVAGAGIPANSKVMVLV